MGAMTALGIESATKTYDKATALDAVSLQFPDGVITAVIGPSGCGKSTLVKLCNGLIRPDSGQVLVFGEPVDYTTLPVLRRRIGYAVQGNVLFPHLTARDNITLLARLENWDAARIDHRVTELMELCQLEAAQLERYPHQLSGGQQQRVGLCRAMMLRPEILLLDEPFAAIDPITREDIQQQVLALQRVEPRTSVLVTHDMREALLLAEHIVVMRAGRVLHSDNKQALIGQKSEKSGTDPNLLLRELLRGDAP
jgi:osmoprotectant transport system ATP-binding protein